MTIMESEYVQLKVVGQDSNEIRFKVKKSTLMGKLMEAYSDRIGAAASTLRFRFLFDGRRINANETPKQLGLENGDVIETFLEQKAGSDRS